MTPGLAAEALNHLSKSKATQNSTMDFHAPLNPSDLFSAKGLVVVITGGGSGTSINPKLPHQATSPQTTTFPSPSFIHSFIHHAGSTKPLTAEKHPNT